MNRNFRVKRLKLNVKREIAIHLRHAAGKLDLTVLGPVTIVVTYPPRGRKKTDAQRPR